MSNLHNTYTKILNILHEIETCKNFLNQKRPPKLSDLELIALALSAESLSMDSENHLFQHLPDPLKGRIERSVYNRRKRNLAFKFKDIQRKLAHRISPCETYHVIDSMPIETCKLSRSKRSKVCKQDYSSAPNYGYCAAQKMYFFGYKLHGVCSIDGVFKSFDISKASTHDIHYLCDIQDSFKNCILIGDKAYLNQQYQLELFNHHALKLEIPMRYNQTQFQDFSPLLRKQRKRIETLFSQLCDQFMIRRNYAKTLEGLATRIINKITSLTIIQYINFANGNSLNHLKKAIY